MFVGTFNTTAGGELIEYLNVGDQRRWWPWLVGVIDIPGLERDRDQLFAEAMYDYVIGGEGCDLYLPPELEAEAKGIAKTREKIDPLADTLSTIRRDVVRMAQLGDDGKPVTRLTTDGVAVTRTEDSGGVYLVKGSEAEPFAMVGADGELWVSAKYVGELVPSSRKSDGNGITNAMQHLGWSKVKDRRTGGSDQRRGWAYAADPTL